MGRGRDREATEMPVFDADATLPESRPVRRAVGARSRGGTARGVGVAVAALVLLTGGVVVGGMLENPGPSASPSLPAASTGATACAPLAEDLVPAFGLGVIGDERTYGGRFGYGYRRGEATGDKGWVVPGADGRGSIASGTALEVRAASGACIRRVVAEFAAASLYHPASEAQALVDAAVDPPSTNPALGTLPDGEWVVRVTSYFETGVQGSRGQVIRQSYFRMRVGPGPFRTPGPSPTPTPDPTPAVTPAVACGPLPVGAEAVELLAITATPDDADVPGATEGAEPPVVDIALGDPVEIQVTGDACATSWDIRVVNLDSLGTIEQDVQLNLDESPDHAAQNRWRLPVGVGDFALVADLRFGPDVTVHREWRMVGLGFTVPDAFLVDADGSRVPVLAGCGLSFSLANGYSTGDSCGGIGYPDGLEVLHVAAWSPVVLEIPGWTITSWYGNCGRVSGAEASQAFETVNGCYLGNYSVAPGASPPAPVRFLARPGEQSVQLGITASRDGTTFSVAMYGVVDGQ